MAELIPGIDLLSDAFRSNGRSVLAALRWITEELARARYLITVGELLRKKDFLKTGGAVVLSEVVITLCFGARGLGSNSDLVTVFQLWYGWPLGKIDEMIMRRGWGVGGGGWGVGCGVGCGVWSCNLPSITYLSWRCANIPSYVSYSLQLLWGNRDKLWQLFESFSFALKQMLFTFFEVFRYINWMLFCFCFSPGSSIDHTVFVLLHTRGTWLATICRYKNSQGEKLPYVTRVRSLGITNN